MGEGGGKEGKEREKEGDKRRPLQLSLGAVTSATGLLLPLESFKKGASVPGASEGAQEAGGSRHRWGI